MLKQCNNCKKEFIIVDGEREFKTCEKCRDRIRKAQLRFRQKETKTIHRDSHLDQTEAERRAYNEKHGTHLSYGKYVAFKNLELLENNQK